MCGLCIPHCPTYQLFQTESESPRGRIALFKALAQQQLEMSDALFQSLDHCLICRACEKMCPSQVDYSTISRLGRELMHKESRGNRKALTQKVAEKVLATPSLHPFVKMTSKAIAPVQKLMPNRNKSSSIGHLIQAMAPQSASRRKQDNLYPAPEAQGQVILFAGCSGELFEQETLADCILLLNTCGYDVVIPDKSSCCGAIKLRDGDTEGLLTQAQQTIENLEALLSDSQAVVVLNNSCSGQLQEYSRLKAANTDTNLPGARQLADKTRDIMPFLLQALKEREVDFVPLNDSVSVHISCSLRNVLNDVDVLMQLLQLIPDIQLQKLDDRFCCGAAGSYMLSYPDVANRLLDDKINDVISHSTSLLVSSNLGCSLHFKQGLKKQGRTIEVLHPVRLLARQLIKEN